MIYKTLHRKLKIEQHKPHYKQEVNSSDPEDKTLHRKLKINTNPTTNRR
jgi:hypothetical protein